MAKEDLILRDTTNAPLTTKASELTWAEGDANIIEMYNSLVSLSQSSYIAAYDAAVTYDDTNSNYVTYSSQTWKMINGTPQVNVTPGTDALTWTAVYATDAVGKSGGGTLLFERSLTPTEIKSMNTTPIELIATPGAGKAIVVQTAVLFLDHAGPDYLSGGQIELHYDGNSLLTASSAFLLTASDDFQEFQKNYDTLNITNESLYITNGTTDFTTGEGILKIKITYYIADFN